MKKLQVLTWVFFISPLVFSRCLERFFPGKNWGKRTKKLRCKRGSHIQIIWDQCSNCYANWLCFSSSGILSPSLVRLKDLYWTSAWYETLHRNRLECGHKQVKHPPKRNIYSRWRTWVAIDCMHTSPKPKPKATSTVFFKKYFFKVNFTSFYAYWTLLTVFPHRRPTGIISFLCKGHST